MFPCEMARYIAGFPPEARKYGRFWGPFSAALPGSSGLKPRRHLGSAPNAPSAEIAVIAATAGVFDAPGSDQEIGVLRTVIRDGKAENCAAERIASPAMARLTGATVDARPASAQCPQNHGAAIHLAAQAPAMCRRRPLQERWPASTTLILDLTARGIASAIMLKPRRLLLARHPTTNGALRLYCVLGSTSTDVRTSAIDRVDAICGARSLPAS